MEIDCLIISDGTKGMENQSIAVSKLLNLNFKILKIKTNNFLKSFPQLAIFFDFFL